MTDAARVPHEPNWADYIDALCVFDPPTLRLARRQQALKTCSDRPPASGQVDAWQRWNPADAGDVRK